MKRLFLAGALAASLALGACATKPILSPQVRLGVAKTDYGLEVAFNVAMNAYLVAKPSLTPEVAAQAKHLIEEMKIATDAAYTAARLGDSSSLMEQISLAYSLKDQVVSLVSHH